MSRLSESEEASTSVVAERSLSASLRTEVIDPLLGLEQIEQWRKLA
jgi:hypothetical protein